MGRLFGTDGVRGVANRELTAELALALGAAAARRLASSGELRRRVAVVGRDPRASGEMLEAAVIAGLTSEGIDALRVGVLPTPAVAYLTGAYDADFGVMISASHNPMPDNGIKIFGPGGHKLDDATEDQIEDLVAAGPGLRPAGSGIGRVIDAEDALDRYLRHVGKSGTVGLDGLTVVVDCAHGAASVAAPRAYRAAGARVMAIHAEPNGLNINDRCGSTHLDAVRSAVLAHGADLGLAHDGDADRCLAIDATGQVVDGDAIMVILARAMKEAGERLHDELSAAGVEVLLDDRDVRAGVKFKDADLIGIPLRVVIGERGLKEGKLEMKWRWGKQAEMIDLAGAAQAIADLVVDERKENRRFRAR